MLKQRKVYRATMSRIPQPSDSTGSLWCIQRAVNDHPQILETAIAAQLPHLGPIDWVSPLRQDNYAEYRDQDFLLQLRLDPATSPVPLSRFWPSRGPQWDALGRTPRNQVVLIEAKANIPELLSPPCQASPTSARLIKRSLGKTQQAFKARPGCDWSIRFYQYANRLAHLFYLWRLCHVDAYLVFVYFLNAPGVVSPTSAAEWRAAIEVLHEALGIRGRVPRGRVVDVFLDAAELAVIA